MIYITGDTHIPIDISKLNSKLFPEQKSLDKNDFLIICGDFGGVWAGDGEDRYWQKWLSEKPFTTLFIDGNHENFDLLYDYDVVGFMGGLAHKINDSLYHLMRGQCYTIEDKRFFVMGGACSHDRSQRIEGKSWWPEEMPSNTEFAQASQTLDEAHWSVDYILTHCAPTSLQTRLSDYPADMLTDFLQMLWEKATYQHWFFGHYHIDAQLDDKHTCVYQEKRLLTGGTGVHRPQ